MNLPKRKNPRLQGYDYSQNGAYFVTICSHKRKPLFSHIVGRGLAPAENRLTDYGRIAEEQLLNLPQRYPHITVDKYVIMPNHIHMILFIQNTAGASPRPTLSAIICTYKSLTTRLCKQHRTTDKMFQTSFHDHIIRNEAGYQKIWEYIDQNPAKWQEDTFYVE